MADYGLAVILRDVLHKRRKFRQEQNCDEQTQCNGYHQVQTQPTSFLFNSPQDGVKCSTGLYHSGDPEALAALVRHTHLHLPRLSGLQGLLERSKHSTWNWELVSLSGSTNISRIVNLFRHRGKIRSPWKELFSEVWIYMGPLLANRRKR